MMKEIKGTTWYKGKNYESENFRRNNYLYILGSKKYSTYRLPAARPVNDRLMVREWYINR